MQRALAGWTARVLSDILQTRVEIGSIDLGFLNHYIINDMNVYDRKDVKMLRVSRVTASVSFVSLLRGQIEVPTARLFGTNAVLYKDTPDAEPNYQFVLDAFKSDSDDPSSVPTIRVNSFIVRNTNVSYDILSEPQKPQLLDQNHISVRNLGFDLSLKQFSEDSLNIAIKRFAATEKNSGMAIRKLTLDVEANRRKARLTDLEVCTAGSTLRVDSALVDYAEFQNDKSFSVSPVHLAGTVNLSDAAPFAPVLRNCTTPYTLSADFSLSDKVVDIQRFQLCSSARDLNLDMQFSRNGKTMDARLNELSVSGFAVSRLISELNLDPQTLEPVVNLGSLRLNAVAHYDGSIVSGMGGLQTEAGDVLFTAEADSLKQLTAQLTSDGMDIASILGNEKFGMLAFSADANLNLDRLPEGKVVLDIPRFDYNGYEYSGLNIDADYAEDVATARVSVDDENVQLTLDACLTDISRAAKSLTARLAVQHFRPYACHIANDMEGNDFAFSLESDVRGSGLDDAEGHVVVTDVNLSTPTDTYSLDSLAIYGSHNRQFGTSEYWIKGDFIDATLSGVVSVTSLPVTVRNLVSRHLPSVVSPVFTMSSPVDADYSLVLRKSDFVNYFIGDELNLREPLSIAGSIDSSSEDMSLELNANVLEYNNVQYDHINLRCVNNMDNLSLTATGIKRDENSLSKLVVLADADKDRLHSDISLRNDGEHSIRANLQNVVTFADSLGSLRTAVELRRSEFTINDTVWTVNPAYIYLYKEEVGCSNLKISDTAGNYIMVDGVASPNPSDSIVATLHGMELEYVLNLVDFHSVEFDGRASGRVVVSNIYGTPELEANLHVDNFCLQDGHLGNADIHGTWDKELNGIALKADFIDFYDHPDGLSGKTHAQMGILKVDGYVSPANSYLDLGITLEHTSVDFLYGYLKGPFRRVDGSVTGQLHVVGPFSDINLIGDVEPDMIVELTATKVPYHAAGSIVHLRNHIFDIPEMVIRDAENNTGLLTGAVTHNNFKNWGLEFNVQMNQLLGYDEKEFNEDKFYATVYCNGSLTISDQPGQPMYINADVTPTRGSVFAYDSATPDALANGSFIQFRNGAKKEPAVEYADERTSEFSYSADYYHELYDVDYIHPFRLSGSDGSFSEAGLDEYEYSGDMYINFNINLDPNCEIKLRMDNTEDGYMTTAGTGNLQAKLYNKGAFQLFGTYNIQRGSYRLFLQDLIYRDLAIQDGSSVEFIGEPFDANIHLICHHTINSVPLSDLTATRAFSQNNKVKVICVLDITGKLGNMEFAFDLQLPNVNDEIRQLVKSMINSEEEMNTQIIYLLGLGRFYPNEFARANGEDNSSQAVSSLVSSTLSGQINQMLSSLIGSNSNWNFGTGITTGEKGWDDLDVEGILSGRLLNERILINGAFGYRDNAMTNQANFIGDFEVKWRVFENRDFYLKAYNQANDRYFTKASLNTQGIGINFQYDFEKWRQLFEWKRRNSRRTSVDTISVNRTDTMAVSLTDSVKNHR